MVTADNPLEQRVLDFFATLSASDLEKLRFMLHEEATWTPMVKSVPGSGQHVGRKGIIDEFLMPVRGMFIPGDPKVIVDTLTSKGNRVIAETRGVGELSNGNHYDNQYVWVFEFKDDLVFAIREYMDSGYVLSVV